MIVTCALFSGMRLSSLKTQMIPRRRWIHVTTQKSKAGASDWSSARVEERVEDEEDPVSVTNTCSDQDSHPF